MHQTILMKQGVSLIELLTSVAIIGGLLALLLPAIIQVRESSRVLSCRNKLRQLGLGALNYESAKNRFPPGNLGFREVLTLTRDNLSEWDGDPSSDIYWQKAPHTSSLVFLLPFLELEELAGNAHPALTSINQFRDATSRTSGVWIGDWSTVSKLTSTKVPLFQCPSDSSEGNTPNTLGLYGAQPVFIAANTESPDGYLSKLLPRMDHDFSSTNYVGCSGAHSGGQVNDLLRPGFHGILGCSRSLRAAEIRDGTSNTLLFSESIGGIQDGQRMAAFPWTFGCLARGRGGLPWGMVSHPRNEDVFLFGDHTYSSMVGFGSMHQAGVNIVRGDGSTRMTNRDIFLPTWYALAGAADGRITPDE